MTTTEKKLINWQKIALKQIDFCFINKIIKSFSESEIYLVGGATRDIILEKKTKDFDFVIRNIDPSELENFLSKEGEVNLVGKSFGVFKFVPKRSTITKSNPIEIALPRTEQAGMSGGYKDFDISTNKNLPIEEDLSRRDFTINALAWNVNNQKLIDEFDGLKDLKNKTIRAIGDPKKRFQEDYTRMLRGIRFAVQLNFQLEEKTKLTIKQKAKEIKSIASERINEELTKIILSDNAETGIRLMQKIGLLKILIPELEAGVGVKQNKAHIYEVFDHNVRALGFAAKRNYSLEIRLASLLHDVAKPQTKEGKGKDATFYNHDIEGAKTAKKILRRLSFSNDITKKVTHLVRYHMFYYSLDIVSDAGVRRLLNRLGKENIDDFINLRICDRLGMGRPKAKPWKLVQLERRFKEVQLDPITPKMIKIKGDELMKILDIKPGPRVGMILNALLGEVLDDPKRNEKKYLINEAKKLNALSDKDLKKLHPDIKYYEEEQRRNLHQEK